MANSLAAVKAGARQVECTINGLGERAGNASLEEVVMALKTRSDAMPFATGIKTEDIMKASRLVSGVTGFAVQPNKAIVGANAFAHEAGIHQDGVLKHTATYEIMTPASVGLQKSTLVMGKHSGRHAFKEKLKELGFELGDNEVNDAFQRFKDLADRKAEILMKIFMPWFPVTAQVESPSTTVMCLWFSILRRVSAPKRVLCSQSMAVKWSLKVRAMGLWTPR